MTEAEMIGWMRWGLATGQIPSILYKYVRLDGVRAILENGTLKFSRRGEFNDVYECRGNVKTDYSVEDWRRHWLESGYPEDVAKELAEGLMMNAPSEQAQTLKRSISDVTDRLGILCLTRNRKNILMWAHYADEHRGACLEFDIEQDLTAFCFPKKVEYGDDYPLMDFLNNKESATEVIFHKARVWSYEEEYRVIDLNAYAESGEMEKEDFTKQFNKEALVGIYFGCRCSDEEINEIKNLAANHGFTHVRFYKMEMDETMYKLNARLI